MSSIVKEKYEYIKKAERDRIIGQGFIPSYGKMPVINKKYDQVVDKINQKIVSLKEMNKDLTDLQKSYIDILETKIDLARLKILYENLPSEDEKPSLSSSILSMLSYRDWCGRGTNIYKNINEDLDNPIGMFKVDAACLKHDIAYSKAKTKEEQHKADVEMLYELGQKYIFNYENNFLTGDYKTDFTNWSSSFKTVSNYLLSFAETVFTGYLIKSNIMSIFNLHKYYLMALNPLATSNLFYNQGLELPQPYNLRDYRTRGALDEDIRQIGDLGRAGFPNAFKEFGINLFFSTVLKDKFLAIGTFLLMSGKLALEKFGISDITPIAEHKISEEDIVALESLYKELENEFEIKPSEPEVPVEKEPINIETLKSDITDIIDTNIRYNETKTVIFDAIVSEPVIQPEPIIEPTSVYDYEPLTEEELKRLKIYQELNDYFDKILSETNLITSPYPDLPESTKKESLTPDIEKDIKDAVPSSLLDLPDEENIKDEMFEQPEKNNQEKNDEKNKTEL